MTKDELKKAVEARQQEQTAALRFLIKLLNPKQLLAVLGDPAVKQFLENIIGDLNALKQHK